MAFFIPDGITRQGFMLRVRGATHGVVADVLSLTEVAWRKRWSKLTAELAKKFGRKEG